MSKVIRGAGGGGGGSHTPVESPNSLRSTEYARIIDIISEGEIGGLVNGSQSIFLEGVPITNADQTSNFQGISVIQKVGTPSQSYVPGFSYVETETQVGVLVTQANPITRSISNNQLTSARVRVGIPALSIQDLSNGDMKGYSVDVAIEVQPNGGAWVTVANDTITGKCVSKYVRQYAVPLAGNAPWNIRVRRVSADNSATNIQDKVYFESYSEVIDVKLRRPNIAYFAVQAESTQFSSVPTRSYKVQGRVIRVPSNYNPETKTYSGVWDGTFILAYSSCPPWVFYDIVTHPRYGLQKFADTSATNKWLLYEIGKYCDERVPNGFGGTEPRYTCNHYIQTQQDAYTLLNELASNFDSIPFYGSGAIGVLQDSPRDESMVFTKANVIDGKFKYAGATAKSERHSVVRVTWNNPDNHYKRDIEVVVDEDLVRQWGYRPADIVAVGCTSRGQAQRRGRRLLFTEAMENETVSFTAGPEGAYLQSGEIIRIEDPLKNGQSRKGGRIVAATVSAVQVDKWVSPGASPVMYCTAADGTVMQGTVSSVSGNTVTIDPPFPSAPAPKSVWVTASAGVAPSLWRVVTTSENKGKNKGTYAVNAIKHDINKHAAIDQTPNLIKPTKPPAVTYLTPVTGIVFKEVLAIVNQQAVNRVIVGWNQLDAARGYRVRYQIDNGNWVLDVADAATYEIDIPVGLTLKVSICGIGVSGAIGPMTESSYAISGEALPPAPPANLVLEEPFSGNGARVRWDMGIRVEGYTVKVVKDGTTLRQVYVGATNHFEYLAESLKSDFGALTRSFDIAVRAEGKNGTSGTWSTITVRNEPPVALLNPAVYAIPKALVARTDLPSESDFAGIIVWLSKTNNFTPTNADIAYKGRDAVAVINQDAQGAAIVEGTTYYARMAAYDTFGTTELIKSAQLTTTGIGNGQAANALLTMLVSTIPALSDGTTLTYAPATNNTLVIYVNGKDDTVNWTINKTPSNCTVAGTNPYSISAMPQASDVGWVDFVLTKAGFDPINLKWTISKQKQGAQGSAGNPGNPGTPGTPGTPGSNGATAYNLSTSGSSGTVTVNGSLVVCTTGTGAWNSQAYSIESFVSGAYASAQPFAGTQNAMFGLNSDPTGNASYDSLDFAWYTPNGTLRIYEGGNEKGEFGSYDVNTTLGVYYNGSSVTYYKNGSAVRTVSAPVNAKLHFDSSYTSTGSGFKNIAFGAFVAPTSTITANGHNNNTGGPSNVTLSNGQVYEFWGVGRGHTVFVFKPDDLTFYASAGFDTYSGEYGSSISGYGGSADELNRWVLNNVPYGYIMTLISKDACSVSGALRTTLLNVFGGPSANVDTWAASRTSHAFIGQRGLKPGQAYENYTPALMPAIRANANVQGLIANGSTGAQGPQGSQGAQGPAGQTGATGTRGSVTVAAQSNGWSDYNAYNAIASLTGTGPINSDICTLYYNNTYAETKFYSSGLWVSLNSYINGNLLVNGTVQGDKLVANSITAGKLNVTTLSAISGNVGFLTSRLNGSSSGYEQDNDGYRVYEGSTLRVKIGKLS